MKDRSPLAELEATALVRLVEPHRLAELQRNHGEGYEMSVFMKARSVSEMLAELEHTTVIIGRTKTFTEMRLLLKFYIITFVSLSDVVAALINETLELGYAPQDVSFQVILRNRKVASSPIPGVVSNHRDQLKFDRYQRVRNELVHRGDFQDSELDALEHDWLQEVVQAVQAVDPEDREAVNAAARNARDAMGLREKAKRLLATKQSELRAHLSATHQFLGDLAVHLVAVVRAR